MRQSASPAADPALDTIDENKAAERGAETVADAPAQDILDAVTSMGFSIHAGATTFYNRATLVPAENSPPKRHQFVTLATLAPLRHAVCKRRLATPQCCVSLS